jgi:capsular exopolysaccharide synthesis family protein
MNDGFKQDVSVRHAEDDYVISLGDVIRIVWERAWLIILVTLLALGSALGWSYLQTPQYQSSIKLLVGQERGIIGPEQNPEYLITLSQTIAPAIMSRPMAEGVDKKLDLRTSPEYLLYGLTAEPIADTQFVEVSYTGSDPEQTQRIVNAFGEVASEKISTLSPNTDTLTVTVWERATSSGTVLISPDPLRNGLFALVGGSMLGIGLALLLGFLDKRWRSPQEVEQATGVPSLGVIYAAPSTRNERGWILPDGLGSEQYRILRTNLLHVARDGSLKTVMVSSPGPEEGKTTVCANLGLSLAQAGKSTLIVDCDLRRPMLHKAFGLKNLYGVVDAVVGGRSPQETWQEPLPGLWVMTAGPIPPNPAELLDSEHFAELLDWLRQEFDYVLVDSGPIDLVSDPAILASRVDGVLLVIDPRSSREDDVQRAMRSLDAVGANILGTVMNKVRVNGTRRRYNNDLYYSHLHGRTEGKEVILRRDDGT